MRFLRTSVSLKLLGGFFFLSFLLSSLILTVFLAKQRQEIRKQAAEIPGMEVQILKLFGQKSFTETSRNAVTPKEIYHAPGVVVDRSSTPNKVYVFDSGNNRILGFNGIGFCTNNTSLSCTIDSDCQGGTCQANGTKDADIVFGQSDFQSASCNRDNNLGITKSPAADTFCLTGYPFANNIAESWTRANFDVDTEGNLYVPDWWNNRILKFNRPFSQDKSNGKGDNIADFVWGQDNFTSNGINRGSSIYQRAREPDNRSLYTSFGGFADFDHVASRGVSVDSQGNVWVADTFNSRVLRFPPNSQEADLVLGQPDFSSFGCTPNGPLNKMCTPTLAKINPETGELYVLDEFPAPFKVRILVFHPPFTNGMSAYKTIIPHEGPTLWGGQYIFQATGFAFNSYRQNEYASGILWVNEHQTNRTILIDANGEIVKVIGARDKFSRGGDTQYNRYPGCGSIYDGFNLWSPGGSIGLDSADNIYLADERFHRLAIYSLPYNLRAVRNTTCLPLPKGGLFPGTTPNTYSDEKLGEAVGLTVFGNQLVVQDEGGKLKIWNDYLQKQNGAGPDIVVSGGLPRRSLISSSIDDSNRLWMFNEGGWAFNKDGKIKIYQLPFQDPTRPLANFVKLYWQGTTEEIPYSGLGAIAFDKFNRKLYISDPSTNRILRVSNYNEFANKLYVDMVIGQPDKTSTQCNHGSPTPIPDGLCVPTQLKFDNLANLYVVENAYECRGNDRITVFLANDLNGAQGMFPNLSANKVFIANSFIEKGPCAYNTVDKPGSPVSLAFSSANQLVIGNDGYYGDPKLRQLRQLWFYNDPLNKQTPDGYINLVMGTPGDMIFDSSDNLIVQDYTWNRVLVLNIGLTTPTPTPGGASLSFRVKFQGIINQRPNQMAKIILKQQDQEKYRFNNVSITASADGVYTGTVGNILPETYDLFIKGWAHLQKKFGNVTINPGTNTQDFSGGILKAGDAIDNNRVDIYDYNKIVEHFGPRMPPEGSIADFDLDNDVDIFDYNYLVGNFNQAGD